MNSNALWTLFEKTGNIGAYILYHDSCAANVNLGSREAAANANKDRRTDCTGPECR